MTNLAYKMPNIETRMLSFSDMSERQLVEERNNRIQSMEDLISKGKKESRALSGTEENRFHICKSEVNEIDRLLQAKKLNFNSSGSSKVENRALFEEQAQHLMEYLTKGEMRNLTASGSGGAVVPTEISNMIIDKIVNQSPLLQLANRIETNADVSVPVFDFTQVGAGYILEGNEIIDSSQDFSSIKLTNHIIAGLVKCSRSLVNRSDINVLEYLTGALARNIAYFLERELILGTGTNSLRGLTTLPAGQQMTGAGAGAITGDEMIELLSMLPASLQEQAIFVMNPTTWAEIMKLKTTGGDYLFSVGQFGQNMGQTLLGKRVHVSDSVPSQATGEKFIYCLDPQSLTIKMTTQVGVQLLDQAFASTYNYGLMGFVECDSAVTTTQGVVSLIGA